SSTACFSPRALRSRCAAVRASARSWCARRAAAASAAESTRTGAARGGMRTGPPGVRDGRTPHPTSDTLPPHALPIHSAASSVVTGSRVFLAWTRPAAGCRRGGGALEMTGIDYDCAGCGRRHEGTDGSEANPWPVIEFVRPGGDAADVPLGAADSYPIHRRAVPDRQRPLGRLLPGGLPLPPGRGGGRPAGPSAVGAGERGRLPRPGGP